MFAASADIRRGQNESAGQRALHIQIPLMRQRIQQVRRDGGNGAKRRKDRLQIRERNGCISEASSLVLGALTCRELSDAVRRAAGRIVQNIREQPVVEDPVSRANNGFIPAEEPIPETWCVGYAYPRRKVVLVALLLSGEYRRKRGSGQTLTEAGIQRGEGENVFRGAPVFVAQPKVECQVLLDAPGILEIRCVRSEERR